MWLFFPVFSQFSWDFSHENRFTILLYSGNCQDKDFYDARTPRAAGFETGFYKGGLGLDGVGDRAVGCEAGGGQ